MPEQFSAALSSGAEAFREEVRDRWESVHASAHERMWSTIANGSAGQGCGSPTLPLSRDDSRKRKQNGATESQLRSSPPPAALYLRGRQNTHNAITTNSIYLNKHDTEDTDG